MFDKKFKLTDFMSAIVSAMFILLIVVGFMSLFNELEASTKKMDHKNIIKQMKEAYSEDDKSFVFDEKKMYREENLTPMHVFRKIKKSGPPKKKVLKMRAGERKGADWSHRDTPIKNQWNGTCTAFSGVAGIENLLNKPDTLDLSERDAWSKYRKYSNEVFVDTMTEKGNEICPEEDWPQRNKWPYKTCKKNRNHKLINAEYIESDIDLALDALDRGSVVYLGMATPKDMISCRSVIRTGSKFSNGGHAILIVGYEMDNTIKGGGYFIIKNSWGEDCGDNGYQYLPFYQCQKRGGYCDMWEFSKKAPIFTPPKYEEVKVCQRIWWKPWRWQCWTEKVEI